MEDRAFRRSRKMPSEEQSKEEPLVKPLQPTEVKNSSSGREDSQDVEEEQTEAPAGRGRISRELRKILRDEKDFIGAPRNNKRRNMEATRIMCDNQSCIKHSENPVFHDRSKHIDIRCHFVRDCVQRGAIQLSYTPTREQVADILTKAFGRTKFDCFREKMGMVKNPFQ
eukprot:PITA_03433